jgi:hypothetical protein
LAQAANSSNWREAKSVPLALSIIQKQAPHLLQNNPFILWRTDNTCAKALMNKLYSSTGSLMCIARDIVRLARSNQFDLAAVHVKGTDNGLADLASRVSEALYTDWQLSPLFLKWVASVLPHLNPSALTFINAPLNYPLKLLKISKPLTPPARHSDVVLCVPPPTFYRKGVKLASRLARLGWHSVLLLPVDSPQPNHDPNQLQSLLAKHGAVRVASTPGNSARARCPIFEPRSTEYPKMLMGQRLHFNSPPLALASVPQGGMFLWSLPPIISAHVQTLKMMRTR